MALEKSLNDWLDKLHADGVAAKTQKLYFHSVKKFIDVNLPEDQLNWKKIELPYLDGRGGQGVNRGGLGQGQPSEDENGI